MNMTNSIIEFRRYLKRRNYSAHTIKNYLHSIKQFVVWVDMPIEKVTYDKVSTYIDHLMKKRLSVQTINSNLYRVKAFYNYLHYERKLPISVPVKTNNRLRTPKPLPQFLRCKNGSGPWGRDLNLPIGRRIYHDRNSVPALCRRAHQRRGMEPNGAD